MSGIPGRYPAGAAVGRRGQGADAANRGLELRKVLGRIVPPELVPVGHFQVVVRPLVAAVEHGAAVPIGGTAHVAGGSANDGVVVDIVARGQMGAVSTRPTILLDEGNAVAGSGIHFVVVDADVL